MASVIIPDGDDGSISDKNTKLTQTFIPQLFERRIKNLPVASIFIATSGITKCMNNTPLILPYCFIITADDTVHFVDMLLVLSMISSYENPYFYSASPYYYFITAKDIISSVDLCY